MRGRKPFRIPQIPKRRTLSPATGHDRDRHRSRSRSRTSQRSTGSKASRRSRPNESPEYSPSDCGGNQEEVVHSKDVAQKEEAHLKEEEEALLKDEVQE